MDSESTTNPQVPARPTAGGPTRRQVLRGAGAGLGTIAVARIVAVTGQGTAALADTAQGGAGRAVDFGDGWRFALVNPDGVTDPTGGYENAPDPGFDDSTWRVVRVPHDWSIELTPVDSGSTNSGTGFLPGGLGWYRKTFTLPSALSGKRLSVEFDGVYMNASVYFNGTRLGRHPYGYTGFAYDLTDLAHTDGSTPNVLAVRAENHNPSSRWYSGSGIFRDVRLVATSPVHVARHGTFVTTPDAATTVKAGYARAYVATDVVNDGTAAATVRVVATVTGPGGGRVAHGTRTVEVRGGDTKTAAVDLRIDHPELWSVDHPRLYELRTELVVDGAVVDTVTTEFGVRHFAFDPDDGFSLNGTHMKLQGVDLHATLGPLGAAVHRDAIERQLRAMKGMGVNAVRTAHNPPAQQLVRVCDRLGILLMVEAFDCWHSGKVAYDYHLYFDAWGDRDIAEMVHESKNSPAVVLWSIGNETPDTWKPGGPAIARRLIDDIRAIDTSRPIVMGSDQYRSVPEPGSPQDQIVTMLDGLGLNYNTAMSLDALHDRYPDTFFFESESSSETSTRGVYQDPELLNTGENHTPGKRATSSYDNNMASWTMSGEYSLKKDRDRKFFAGQFLWAGQDYIGEPTPYDVFPVKSSFFGAVDTAGFAKDAYHLFASQWTSEPMVHIVPMNWTDHVPGEKVAVWVYSNVDTVELLLNGRSLGVRRFDRKTTTFGRHYLETSEPTGDDKNYPSGSYTSPNGDTGKLHLTWQVPYHPGRLTAVARRDGRTVARDELVTAGRAHAVRLTPDRRVIAADGRSLSFVTVEIVDSRGAVVPGADDLVHLTVAGPGTPAAVDNGRQESAHSYLARSVHAFNGTAIAVIGSTGSPGTVSVRASAPGLRHATARIRCTATTRPRLGGAAPLTGAAATPLPVPAARTHDTPAADASYSGAPDTVPAAMLDGDPDTGWSNYYDKAATATLPAVSVSRPADWVSLRRPRPRAVGSLTARFVTGGALARPADLTVTYWDGHRFRPVRDLHVAWAAGSGGRTVLTFRRVRTTEVRLDMTSPAPGTATGFLRIAELTAHPD